ncbi:hypothetical protein GGTG_00978 [Gaeumannomyces tritici R3-111a-1]|uniref:FAS1 domain-containing protein n=1 Tax=Gaeumannomyces tritici (strain R3-111a-1) TaxID=644352 RepID=J3NI95_GAET3|nr:hypothetical protein GGTG_00978 [Gaeumannomyces tritici R3-111a-1]EJT80988.1 hypothetical protein GGTG_00978 [Gaeumannomyces tritici R3-111a-1]
MSQGSNKRSLVGAGVLLSDVLGDKRVNGFGSLVRNVESTSRRANDPRQASVVLSPLNSALEALPQKPWEDAADYSEFGSNAYEGAGGRDRAQGNIQRFVERYIVPVAAQDWAKEQKIKSIGQDTLIWWEENADGKRTVRRSGKRGLECNRISLNECHANKSGRFSQMVFGSRKSFPQPQMAKFGFSKESLEDRSSWCRARCCKITDKRFNLVLFE